MFVSAFSPDLMFVSAMLSGCGVAAVVEEGDEYETSNLLGGVLHFCRLSMLILSTVWYLDDVI